MIVPNLKKLVKMVKNGTSGQAKKSHMKTLKFSFYNQTERMWTF